MEHVAYYPDPVNLNLTHGDPKGHYKWSISYYDLAKTAFLPNHLPHFLQGEEYAHLNMSFCARRGVCCSFQSPLSLIPRLSLEFILVCMIHSSTPTSLSL